MRQAMLRDDSRWMESRATLAFDKIGLKKEAKVVGHGYSGGGIQTGWTAALKKTYAPEINTVG